MKKMKIKNQKKIFIGLIAGGTGGHIYPLLSVAKSVKKGAMMNHLDFDLRYFGSAKKFSKSFADEGIKMSSILGSKWRRYSSILNYLDIFKFFAGFIQAMFKLYWYMPDVIFSKSGPGVLPVIFAARWYRIPVVIHESDAVAGKANYISSKHAKIIEVAFEEAKLSFSEEHQKRVRVVGNPIREDVLVEESRAESRKVLGVPGKKPVLLILGGSQGAEKLNYFFLENSENFLADYEVIHQIGEGNFESFVEEFKFMSKNYPQEFKASYYPYGYFSGVEMAHALNACDLVLARSGSGIFEIAAHGRPAILVPLSGSANNHQQENAYIYQGAGAGVVMEEENLLPTIFTVQADKILKNGEVYKKMSEAAKSFYHPNAADYIAHDILSLAVRT